MYSRKNIVLNLKIPAWAVLKFWGFSSLSVLRQSVLRDPTLLYVANRVPICGPYVPHMWPIGFDCSSVNRSRRLPDIACCHGHGPGLRCWLVIRTTRPCVACNGGSCVACSLQHGCVLLRN